jgi:hypothetical protein
MWPGRRFEHYGSALDIDGATQNISSLACKQPNGTWQIQQQDTGVEMGARCVPRAQRQDVTGAKAGPKLFV